MDYSTFKDSIMIADQSAWQQLCYSKVNGEIDCFAFIKEQNITVWVPAEAKKELAHQVYSPNLFSGIPDDHSTTSGRNVIDATSCVFSETNGTLTRSDIQPDGLSVVVAESSLLLLKIFGSQTSLWDATSMMKKLLQNRRSQVDPANIYLGRYLAFNRQPFFIFTNDQNQIKQIIFEGFKYLRPDKFFVWMCKDKFIDSRKGGWNFKRRRKHNLAWTEPNKKFKDILKS